MKPGRKTLVGSDGSLLGVGEKVGALEAMRRLSNESHRVYDLWSRARIGTDLPRLDAVALSELGDLQDAIVLVDVLTQTHDYRYRQVGPLEVQVRGADPTGQTVRQCYEGEILDFVLESYDRAVASREGVVDFSVDIDGTQRFVTTEVLLLPCADDGRDATHVLVYVHYRDTGRA